MIIYEDNNLSMNITDEDILVVFMKENVDSKTIAQSLQNMINGIENTYSSYRKIQKKMGLLFDARNLDIILPIKSIWGIAKFFGSTKDITEEIVVGSAIVTGSDMVISLVNAFSKLYQNVKPMKFTKEINEGTTFLFELFNKEIKETNTSKVEIGEEEIQNMNDTIKDIINR